MISGVCTECHCCSIEGYHIHSVLYCVHTCIAVSTLFSLSCGHIFICQFLVAANAEVNSKDVYGETPLHHASR